MPHPLIIFSQSEHLIWIVDINSHTYWQTVQIQISWLLKKPTDLDLHCLQKQGISRFSRTRLNWAVSCEKVSSSNFLHIPKVSSVCSPFKQSIISNDSDCGKRRPDQTVDAQADLGLCCLHIPEDTFSQGRALWLMLQELRIWLHCCKCSSK